MPNELTSESADRLLRFGQRRRLRPRCCSPSKTNADGARWVRIFQVRDIDWEVKAKVWDGAGCEAGFAIRRERVILPYQFRKDQDMHISKDQVLHTRFYFDGKSGWGSFADMAKLKDMPVADLGRI